MFFVCCFFASILLINSVSQAADCVISDRYMVTVVCVNFSIACCVRVWVSLTGQWLKVMYPLVLRAKSGHSMWMIKKKQNSFLNIARCVRVWVSLSGQRLKVKHPLVLSVVRFFAPFPPHAR